MESLRKNWAFLAIGAVSLLLGGLALITALRLRQESPVAPTAPTGQEALEGNPVAACTTQFTLGAAPSTSPVASASPSASPGIEITKSANAEKANPGDVLTYGIDIENTSNAPLYDVYFEEQLDVNTTYVSPSMLCTLTRNGQAGQSTSFEIDTLADGFDTTPEAESTALRNFRVANKLNEANNAWDLQSGDVIHCSYRVIVNAGVAPGTDISNRVSTHGDNLDGPGGEDPTDETTTIVEVSEPVDIETIKTANKEVANPGDTISYTVRLRNSGTQPLYDVYFDETLATYTTYKSPSMSCQKTTATGGSIASTFQIDNLADGFDTTPEAESTTLRNFRIANALDAANNTWDLNQDEYITCFYEVTVDANAPAGVVLTNSVVGHGDGTNGPGGTDVSDEGEDTVTVGTNTIQVTKSSDRSSVNPGDTMTYTVRLTNNSNVVVYDGFFDENLSDYTDYDGGMSCNKTTSSGTSSIGFQIDDLSTSAVEAVSEASGLDRFRVTGNLSENNNNWDLNPGEYISCTYRVKVLSNAPANTSLVNNVSGHFDNKNGDQPNETDISGNASTSVVVNQTQCNQTCTNSNQCGSQICYITSGQTSGVCRNNSCPTDGDCSCNFVATPVPTNTTTPQVPVAGTSWPTIALIGGALLLITLGFAL